MTTTTTTMIGLVPSSSASVSVSNEKSIHRKYDLVPSPLPLLVVARVLTHISNGSKHWSSDSAYLAVATEQREEVNSQEGGEEKGEASVVVTFEGMSTRGAAAVVYERSAAESSRIW